MVQSSSWYAPLSGQRTDNALNARARRCVCLVAVLVAPCFPVVASAQQYKSLPVNDRLRLDAIFAQGYARNPTNVPADKQRFDAFFTQYFFPAMTRFEPENLADLGGMRQDLFSRYLWTSRSEQLQEDLTDKAYNAMWDILRKFPAYHPAVQYNAILVLGMLDEQYAIDAGPNKRPPKPLPEANSRLVTVVESAAKGNPIPPPLLVGALIGLERHARFHESLPPDNLAATAAAAQSVLAMEKPLPNVDSDVAAWIKLRAASVLAELGAVGEGNKVELALMRLVGDKNMSLDDRCQAAALLSKLKYDGVKLDPKSTVDPLVQLTLDVAESEGKRAKEFQDMQMRTGGISSRLSRAGYGGTYNTEAQKYERRPLLSKLIDLRTGLEAVKSSVPAAQQQRIDAVLSALRAVENSATNQDTVDLKLVVEVQDMAEKIRAAAPGDKTDAADEVPGTAFQ